MSSCVTARSGRRQWHERAASPPINLAPSMASGGRLRAPLKHRVRRPRAQLLQPTTRMPLGAFGHRYRVDGQPHAAGLRHLRNPIAIAAALNNLRGVRRGFLPRGLCNTCPDAARVRDRLRARAGVTQALTRAVGRPSGTGDRIGTVCRHSTMPRRGYSMAEIERMESRNSRQRRACCPWASHTTR